MGKTVAKARGAANQSMTQEFTIGPGGTPLVPMDQTQAVLPFASDYGLLSRGPTWLSPTALPSGGTTAATTVS
jgi:hypothetical protein